MKNGNIVRLACISLVIAFVLCMTACSKNASSPPPTSIPTTTKPTIEPTVVPTATPMPTCTLAPTKYVPAPSPTENIDPGKGMFDPWFEAYTGITYSSGSDSQWSYGNQKKEFSTSKPCYVRISNSVVAPWHWGWNYGKGQKITLTYRFIGASCCKISVADGFMDKLPANDPNIVEYTREIEAKAKKDENDIVIFQYTPISTGSVTLEVVYDQSVESKYDVKNTIYLIEELEY